MEYVRIYGKASFGIAVLHGGPGAAGEMKPVAEELAKNFGVLEPLQTAMSVNGQVEELKLVLERHGDCPVILIGYSWGAWLGFIFAAQYPALVKKLILVGSGPFVPEYAKNIMETRLSRLNDEDKQEAQYLLKVLHESKPSNHNALERFGTLIAKVDTYNPIPKAQEKIEIQQDIYQSVWPEASALRESGELLQFGENIECLVVAIHGDYDPHPAEGVKDPLSRVVKNFRFILLNHCGHTPWIEEEAKDGFYRILREEM